MDEVVAFVRDNARRLLGVDDARVLPVSARMAMEAKLSCRSTGSSSSAGTGADSSRRLHFWPASAGTLTSHSDSEGEQASSSAHGSDTQASGGGALSPEEAARLASDARWQRSRFEALERFIYRFLVAGAGTSAASLASTYSSSKEEDDDEEGGAVPGESVRLKLQTPLFVAEALCEQAAACVDEELAAAREDVASLALVRSQLATFRREMGREGQLQREEVGRLVKAAAKRAGGVVDSVLKATNWVGLGRYLLSSSGISAAGGKLLPVSRRMRAEGAGEEAAGVRSMVREHGAWLIDNCQRQEANYRAFAEQRAATLGTPLPMLLAGAGVPGAVGTAAPAAAASHGDGSSSAASLPEAGLLGDLESDADARRRWRELRQAAAAAAADAADYSSWRRASRRVDNEDDESALAATGALDPRRTEILLEEEVRRHCGWQEGGVGGWRVWGGVGGWGGVCGRGARLLLCPAPA